MKINLLLITISMLISTVLSGQTILKGKVQDAKGEGVAFANILLKQNGVFVKGGQTDFDGDFNIPLPTSGEFDVQITYVGYKTFIANGLSLRGVVNYTFKLEEDEREVIKCFFFSYRNPLIQTTPTAGQILYSEDFINRGSIR